MIFLLEECILTAGIITSLSGRFFVDAKPDFRKTWKRQLFVVWMAQFIAANGFSFGLPFAPFFIQQDLQVPASQLPFFVSLFGASAPLTMMLFAPIWGAVADRFGRRKMLLRSYLGGLAAIGLMGFAANPWILIFLRLVQGMFSGTVSAAQTLVSSHTPEEHNGFALGSLHSAMFSGHMTGSFFGGIFAEYFGYRNAFLVTALLMSLSFLLVWLGVEEHFVPVKSSVRKFVRNMIPERKILKHVLPILLLMGFVLYCRQFDTSFVPLLVQDVLGTVTGASKWTGALSAVCGFAGVISGFALGYLSDRYQPGRIAVCSAICAGVSMLAISVCSELAGIFIFRFLAVFAGSGLEPALQIWLSRMTNQENRGLIFGYASSMRSLGNGFAPLAAGAIVSIAGVRGIYVAGPVFFLIAAFAIYRTAQRKD